MSLVLRGEWHMPKKCKNCLLCKPYETRASMVSRICIVTGKRLIYGEAPSNPKGAGRFCPLVELPEKHGRLIDADALKDTLDYYIREAGWSEEINKALRWVKDEFIDSEQAIVEAEGECG